MPTATISIAASGDDVTRWRDDTVYPPVTLPGGTATGTILGVRKALIAANYVVDPNFLRFDTSSIPDTATIVSASLLLTLTTTSNPDTRNLDIEWYPWTTVSDSDFTASVGTSAASVAISALNTSATNTIALTDPAANIDIAGFTGFRMGISGAAPTGNNNVQIVSWDHATLQEPMLVVDLAPTFRFDYSQFPKAMMRSR